MISSHLKQPQIGLLRWYQAVSFLNGIGSVLEIVVSTGHCLHHSFFHATLLSNPEALKYLKCIQGPRQAANNFDRVSSSAQWSHGFLVLWSRRDFLVS
jgi:hypothetical protein